MNYHLFVPLAAAEQQAPSSVWFFVQLLALGVVFYFLLIRPQQKQAKEKAALIAAVKTGDKVVMSSGIHGIVANVKESTVLVKVADNVKLEFDKGAIAAVVKASSES
ncbi:MAG: preprotein translocase subunit YajC [Verrucomicrobia bacterium]|nr:preprotein translocase subunit YajC [Verrucomicrobiota bacterium]